MVLLPALSLIGGISRLSQSSRTWHDLARVVNTSTDLSRCIHIPDIGSEIDLTLTSDGSARALLHSRVRVELRHLVKRRLGSAAYASDAAASTSFGLF